MKSSASKCHFLAISSEKIIVNVNSYNIENSQSEKPLCAKFGNRLTFDEHVSDLCKETSRKIYASVRVTPFLSILQQCVPMIKNKKIKNKNKQKKQVMSQQTFVLVNTF